MKASYDRIAEHWKTSRRFFRPKEEGYLAVLLEAAEKRLPVLDLGCGSGRPIAEFLARAGYRLIGVGISDALLAEARQAAPEATFLRSKIEEVEFEETFCAIVCWDALFHLERQHHRMIFERVHRWLAPGGRFMFSSGPDVVERFRRMQADERHIEVEELFFELGSSHQVQPAGFLGVEV